MSGAMSGAMTCTACRNGFSSGELVIGKNVGFAGISSDRWARSRETRWAARSVKSPASIGAGRHYPKTGIDEGGNTPTRSQPNCLLDCATPQFCLALVVSQPPEATIASAGADRGGDPMQGQ
jgi:hypothetical protein